MKGRTLARGFVAAALALCLMASTAFANHKLYLGEDQNFQFGSWSGTENWVFYWWSASWSSMWWWAESDLDADSQTAANNWQNATGLSFYKVSTRDAADVAIIADNSLDAFGITELKAITTDATRNGNYSYKALVTIKNDGTTPQGGWQATITHELGHFMGLHERYRDDGGSGSFCNSESTIMNSGSCTNRPSQPSSLDIDRISGLYKTGEFLNMSTSSFWFSNALFLSWKDGAWGEYEHRLFLYWWDGAQWIQIDSIGHTGQTGTRELSWNSHSLSRAFNRTSYGKPAGWYTVCGYPSFRYGTVGAWRCSNYSWVY